MASVPGSKVPVEPVRPPPAEVQDPNAPKPEVYGPPTPGTTDAKPVDKPGPSCPAEYPYSNPADVSAANHPPETLKDWKSPPNEVSIQPTTSSNGTDPKNTVSPGYELTIDADLGNPKPQSPLGWLTGGLIELADPENHLARHVAKRDFGLEMNSDNRTLTLPNTEAGGAAFADIQNNQVGYLGNNIDHEGFLKIPAGASPEFVKGYEEESRKNGIENLITAGGLIFDSLPIGAMGRNRGTGVDSVGTRLDPPITKLEGPPLTGSRLSDDVGWRQRGITAEPWNSSMANGTKQDCNWCSMEILTGKSREQLRTDVNANGVLPGEMMNTKEHGVGLFKLGLIDRPPTEVLISGTKNDVYAKMMEYPEGKYFSVTFSDAPGATGHNVVGLRTDKGIEILDGQVNRTYDIRQYPTINLDVYPIDHPQNPNLP